MSSPNAVTLDSKLRAVVGDRTAKRLTTAFDMKTVGDLLRHYPRRYADRGQLTDLSKLKIDEHVTVMARVRTATVHQYTRPGSRVRHNRTEVIVTDGTGDLLLTFFRMPYKAKQLHPGAVGLFSGKVGMFRGQRQLIHPDCKLFDDESGPTGELPSIEAASMPTIIPVYAATANAQSWMIARAVEMALVGLEDPPDPIPERVRSSHGLTGLSAALRAVHQPQEAVDWQRARERLRFEEAFTVQVVLAQRRRQMAEMPAVVRPGKPDGLLARFDAHLPFTLTSGQHEVGLEILSDLARSHPMHRLLQGEVGSGKTVVALRAMMRVIDSDGQAALLAPTEVLAQQHHRSITDMLGPLAGAGMLGGAADGTRVALLTGSLGATARKRALLDAASGEAGIVVGTHALLQEQVQFADLGLVVVDEQHRFGVEQRAALSEKSGDTPPHVLVMTATPIPRTVAMTAFGDLDVSTLRELPAGRSPIQTNVVPTAAKPGWLDRAWERVREEAAAGHQTYVVCARIGDEPDSEADDDAGSRFGSRRKTHSVLEMAELLGNGPLRGLRVAALHGRMPPDEKDRVMAGFSTGMLDVLVSTTVIEVGVDVPNASLMIVMDAERFGVSQLHQLRGRVGRGSAPGLCLLVTEVSPDLPAFTRLHGIAATNDGFALAQLDLEQRREGDVLGVAQSGRRSSLRLLSVLEHEDVIATARQDADAVVSEDPDLTTHPGLALAVAGLHESEQAEFLDKT
jgi:ATP-dependent DNA helicase RecG